jgi:hypothetical protein
MSTSLPVPNLLSRLGKIEDYFLNTWYEIRPQAIDNILEATPIWAALKGMGTFKTQVGGEFITRTIRYGTSTRKAIAKGDTLEMGEPELKTMASWKFRNVSAHVQRDLLDDRVNAGKLKITDYVSERLTAARDALSQGFEEDVMRQADMTEAAHKYTQSLCDIVPDYALLTGTCTYGGISRPLAAHYSNSGNGVYKPNTSTATNPWWGPLYMQFTTPMEVNLVSDMKKAYNSVHNNRTPPNLLLCDQDIFELYEDFGLDKAQIVKDQTSKLVDLGFEVLRFKGKPLIWSPKVYTPTDGSTYHRIYMFNTNDIEVVYDPQLWFAMGNWKDVPLQTARVAHIICTLDIICTQLRDQLLLTSETIS